MVCVRSAQYACVVIYMYTRDAYVCALHRYDIREFLWYSVSDSIGVAFASFNFLLIWSRTKMLENSLLM